MLLRLLLLGSIFAANSFTFGLDEPPPKRSVVFWISVDGIRPDYLDRFSAPFTNGLLASSAYTRELEPVFPSVTFVTHVSKATGALAGAHGITGNMFFDAEQDRLYRYPHWSDLLQSEPIWTTAARQGLRVASIDWPLSHAQSGPHATAYFGERYEATIPDEERIQRLIDLWQEDHGDAPLQLLMGYFVGPDSPGHRFGPNSPEMRESVEAMDALLARIYFQATKHFRATMGPEDEFWFIVTSDHGMGEVKQLVHLGRLTGVEGREEIVQVTTGSVGHLFFGKLAAAEREAAIDQALARLSEWDFAKAWRREELPEQWNYAHPTRTGDVVVALDPNYAFSRTADGVVSPVDPKRGPLGIHGHDPKEDANMLTLGIFHRYPQLLPPRDLGRVDSLRLHATVASLLGIQPAPDALAEPLQLLPDAVSAAR
jgi:hypothetical protein